MTRRTRTAMVRRVRVADNVALCYLPYETTKILPIIPTPPMFAAEIERGRVARADGCCLRQARPEAQRITPTPPYLLLSWPDSFPRVPEPDFPPEDVSTRPSPHSAKERKDRTNKGTPHIRRLVPCCLPRRLLEYPGGYGRMAAAERRDDG